MQYAHSNNDCKYTASEYHSATEKNEFIIYFSSVVDYSLRYRNQFLSTDFGGM